MTTYGFIGLGTMGGRIAGRLVDAGHTVHGYDPTPAGAAALAERGIIMHDSPRAVAAAADVVFSMVADTDMLRAVTTGPDGIPAGLRRGQVYIDMSPVSPDASSALARRVRGLGAVMHDVTTAEELTMAA